jgi:hypothetical protein
MEQLKKWRCRSPKPWPGGVMSAGRCWRFPEEVYASNRPLALRGLMANEGMKRHAQGTFCEDRMTQEQRTRLP